MDKRRRNPPKESTLGGKKKEGICRGCETLRKTLEKKQRGNDLGERREWRDPQTRKAQEEASEGVRDRNRREQERIGGRQGCKLLERLQKSTVLKTHSRRILEATGKKEIAIKEEGTEQNVTGRAQHHCTILSPLAPGRPYSSRHPGTAGFYPSPAHQPNWGSSPPSLGSGKRPHSGVAQRNTLTIPSDTVRSGGPTCPLTVLPLTPPYRRRQQSLPLLR